MIRNWGGTTPLDILLEFDEDKIIISNKKENENDFERSNNDDSDLDIELEFENDLFEEDNKNIWFTEGKIKTIKKNT